MAVISTELEYVIWVDTPRGSEPRTFTDIERARTFRDRTPSADSGTTVVNQEIETTTGTTMHGYERPGLHTEP